MLRLLHVLLPTFVLTFLASALHAQVPDIQGGMLHPQSLPSEIATAQRIRVFRSEGILSEPERIVFREIAAPKMRPGDSWGGPFEVSLRCGIASGRLIRAWAAMSRTAIWFEDGVHARICFGSAWFWCHKDQWSHEWELWYQLADSDTTFIGDTERLRKHIADMMAGKVVTLTAKPVEDSEHFCVSHFGVSGRGPSFGNWVYGQKGRTCRVRIDPKNADPHDQFEGSRAFVGWGVGGSEVLPHLIAALASPKPWVRSEAAVDLGQLGEPAHAALPELRRLMTDSDGYVRILAAQAVRRLDPADKSALPILCAELKSRDFLTRATALEALAELEVSALDAMPAVIDVLTRDREKRMRCRAADALSRIAVEMNSNDPRRQTALETLAGSACYDKDGEVQFVALTALLPFGTDAAMVVPMLEQGSNQLVLDDAYILMGRLLCRIGPAAVPVLIRGLRGKNRISPPIAAWTLGNIGPAAKDAAPVLLDALPEADSDLTLKVVRALQRIDSAQARKAVPFLQPLAKSGDMEAVETLIELGDRSDTLVRELMKSIDPKDAEPHAYWLPQLRKLGPAAEVTAFRLREWVRDDKAKIELRISAAETLADVEPSSTEFVVRFLLNQFETNQWQVGSALRRLGTKARSAEPRLLKWMRDPACKNRLIAAEILWHVAPRVEAGPLMVDRRPEVISVLCRALEDRKSAGDAVWALQGFGPDALPVLPKLLAILADGKSEHWYSVATIVSQIGPAARAAAPTLRLRLAEPQIQIRIQAAKSLSRVAPDDPLALAALIRLEQQVPGVVTEDLGRLGPSARAAIPTLRRTMRYADDEVYQKAVNALRRIDPGDNAKP